MAIYLDGQMREYLEHIFRKVSDWNWRGKRFRGMLKQDRDRKEAMEKCNHVEGEYVGHKTCCSKCGAYYKPGHGYGWELKD